VCGRGVWLLWLWSERGMEEREEREGGEGERAELGE
jgi:hypothetical protein